MQYLILLTLTLTPVYIIKLKLFGLPSDLLMLWVIFIWFSFTVWIITSKKLLEFFISVKDTSSKVLIFTALFFVSGIISLFINGLDRAKLGEFIVLFLQPITLFFISRFIFQKYPKTKRHLLTTSYYLLAISGAYAIIQYLTLLGLPTAWLGNSEEPKRAISFFIHPNFYALWSAPLLALLIPDLVQSLKAISYKLKALLWILGAIGLFLSLSRAGWIGLASAVIVYLIVAADNKIRKIAFGAVAVLFLVIFSVPNFRYRVLLPFYGEKSTVSRFSLWQTGIKAIEQSPITGLGLTGFSKNWLTLNTDAGLTDTHNFPHNIFLDFWVETGLLGLISFIGIVSIFIYRGLKSPGTILSEKKDLNHQAIKLGIALFLITIIFQGLSDNPYFKNDLAMVFWIALSLI